MRCSEKVSIQTCVLMFFLLTQSDSIEERLDEEEEMEEEELERLALLSGRRRTLSLPFSYNYGAIPKPTTPAVPQGPPPLPRSVSWHGERQPPNQNDDE